MIEKSVKIQAEKKYAQIIKTQNNIQNNTNITFAESKDEYQVYTYQTSKIKSTSTWKIKNETY